MSKLENYGVNESQLSSNMEVAQNIRNEMADMKTNKVMYILFDEEVKNVEMCFFAKNDIIASRVMTDFVNSGKCPYSQILDKVNVYAVAEYCEQDGHVFSYGDKKLFHSLADFKRSE